MVDKARATQLEIGISGSDPLPEPVGANYFHFAVVGGEIQMLVGAVNLLQVHEAKNGKAGPIRPQISHRFLLSALGFAQLKAHVTAISESVPGSSAVTVESKKE